MIALDKILDFIAVRVFGLDEKIDRIKINQGAIMTAINKQKNTNHINEYEFKVFSQWGEDGIIQRLVDVIDIPNKNFIEFGVSDFSESNCRFLMMKDNWSGLILDGSSDNIATIKGSYYYWQYDLMAVDAFITRENINDLLSASGFDSDIGILSVDIDGNDYHVLEAIKGFNPRILICEYNAVFGSERKISVPYDPGFCRTEKHHSNLYFGASLGAVCYLAEKMGYCFVGAGQNGANAFFVRNDLMNEKLREVTVAEGYRPSKFRESRDPEGRLTYLSGEDRLKVVSGLPVVNVETGAVETL